MKKILKALSFLILLPSLICTFLLGSFNVGAQEKVVRVGWFDSQFNIADEYGRRSGYSYEYQQSLAIYTGWSYEYVSGSWSALLQMLIEGKIDILSDVSYTEERTQDMIFSTSPMGTEDYYLYKSPNNNSISIDDYSTFNGKKVGINKNSIMIDQFNNWAIKNHVNADVVELSLSVEDALIKLNRGELDLYVSMDGSISYENALPLCKFGSSDFYFAIRKDALNLADELNSAMDKLLNSNPDYNTELHNKYFKTSGVNLYLTQEEKNMLASHGKIKIGYQDNYLAFCAKDPKTSELTGALKDYLNLASDCFKNAHIDFEAIAYPTASDALKALKNKEIDCMFPANLSVYDGEKEGFFMTSPIIRTEIVAVIPKSEQKTFLKKERISVAVNAGNPNYDLFLIDNFPNWNTVYFKNTDECLKGINEKKADCLLISNYRFNNLASKCSEYDLVNLSTGVELDYSFAVNRGDSILYSIMNKITNNVPESSVNSAISYYYTEDAKLGVGDYFNQFFGIIMIILAVIAIIFLVLIFRMILIDKKSKSRQMLIKATEIDDVTGLYNKTFFIEYVNNMYNESKDKPMDFTIIYIDHFRSISDLNGIEFANQLLAEVSDEIKTFIKEDGGIAGYSIEGRFALYHSHIDDYQSLYDRLQNRIDLISPFSNIKIRMGVMPYQKDIIPNEAIKKAILACSMTTTEYKELLIVIDDKMNQKEEINQKLLADLSGAIENKELKIYFQPKFDISGDEYKIIGAEALLRWQHPELGIIEPNDFIPLFENNKEIGNVDRFVRSEVVKQIAEWIEKFNYSIPISVNVSKLEILDQTFEDSINVLMEEYNIDRNLLNIELTEASIIDNINQYSNIINKLRSHGYKIELDDFGVGHSSLKMLSNINVDAIKIDGSAVIDEKNATLIKLILALAKELNVPIIAEGVEDEINLKTLKELGCNYIQGFYLSKPLLVDEFENKYIINKN